MTTMIRYDGTEVRVEEWTPAHHRLPPPNSEVLVWCGWRMVAFYRPDNPQRGGDDWYEEPQGINPIFHVTHWMELPPPPIEETPK